MRTRLRRRRKRLPNCVSCQKSIPRSESDVILRRVDETREVSYHEHCSGGATAMVMVEGPGVWQMIYRHIDQEAN